MEVGWQRVREKGTADKASANKWVWEMGNGQGGGPNGYLLDLVDQFPLLVLAQRLSNAGDKVLTALRFRFDSGT